MQRIHAKSPNKASAADLVERLRATLDEIDGRGGIVAVLDEAQLGESGRQALVNDLGRVRNRLGGYIIAIGDDRRAKGIAVPLCWLPGDDQAEPEQRSHPMAPQPWDAPR